MADYEPITDAEYQAATERGRRRAELHAVSARYDRGRGRIVVRMNTGLELGFSPRDAQGLEQASSADLNKVELVGRGIGLHFPTLDADLSIDGLLAGRLGSAAWMARRKAKHAA